MGLRGLLEVAVWFCTLFFHDNGTTCGGKGSDSFRSGFKKVSFTTLLLATLETGGYDSRVDTCKHENY